MRYAAYIIAVAGIAGVGIGYSLPRSYPSPRDDPALANHYLVETLQSLGPELDARSKQAIFLTTRDLIEMNTDLANHLGPKTKAHLRSQADLVDVIGQDIGQLLWRTLTR